MDDSLGTRIRIERARQRIKQVTLAREVGISPQALLDIEQDRSDPKTSHLRKLALALHVSTDYLIGLSPMR